MLKKLPIRNAKRQAKEYLVFFATMIGAVALIYSFNSLVFSEAISSLMGQGQASGTKYTAIMIIAFSLIIAFILGWFVSYMMNFILRKRSQELSTYMLLGIEKKQISEMFLTENIIIGAAALVIGLVLGFLLAEILNAMLTGSFGGTYSLSSGFSLQAVGLTLLYFLVIYLFALIGSRHKLNKMKLIDLLHYENSNETYYIKKSWIGIAVFCLSIVCGAISLYVLLKRPFGNPMDGYTIDIYIGSLLILLCLFGLFSGLLSFLQNTPGKSKRWKYRKTNLLLYRLFTSKIDNMGKSLGGIATLFTLTIMVFALAIAFSITAHKFVELEAFDLTILHMGEEYDYSEYSRYIGDNSDVESSHVYCLYTNYNSTFMDIRNQTAAIYLDETDSYLQAEAYIYKENRHDTYMKFSDYCALRDMLGYKQVDMSENDFIIHCMPYLTESFENYSKNITEISGYGLSCAGIYTETFSQYRGYGNGQEYILIVPDGIAEQMDILYSLFVANAETSFSSEFLASLNGEFDTLTFLDSTALSSTGFSDDSGFLSKLFDDKDYIRGKSAGASSGQELSAILPLFYLVLVLCMIGTVILAVQLLSENKKYIRHYNMLNIMGLDKTAMEKTARKQMLLHFSLPAIPALVLSGGLTSVISYLVFTSSFHVPIFSSIAAVVIPVVVATILLFLAIYCIYGFMSYISFKKEVLRP